MALYVVDTDRIKADAYDGIVTIINEVESGRISAIKEVLKTTEAVMDDLGRWGQRIDDFGDAEE